MLRELSCSPQSVHELTQTEPSMMMNPFVTLSLKKKTINKQFSFEKLNKNLDSSRSKHFPPKHNLPDRENN